MPQQEKGKHILRSKEVRHLFTVNASEILFIPSPPKLLKPFSKQKKRDSFLFFVIHNKKRIKKKNSGWCLTVLNLISELLRWDKLQRPLDHYLLENSILVSFSSKRKNQQKKRPRFKSSNSSLFLSPSAITFVPTIPNFVEAFWCFSKNIFHKNAFDNTNSEPVLINLLLNSSKYIFHRLSLSPRLQVRCRLYWLICSCEWLKEKAIVETKKTQIKVS